MGGIHDIPQGYEFRMYLTTGSTFDPNEIVYENNTSLLDLSGLPPGNYFLYPAIGPIPINTADSCFAVGPAHIVDVVSLDVAEIPDTTFITSCANPTATITWSDDPDAIFDYRVIVEGDIIEESSGTSYSTSEPGDYTIRVSLASAPSCFELYNFTVENEDFILPQVLSFEGSCNVFDTFCFSPYDPDQTYTLDGVVLPDGCFDEPDGEGSFLLEISRPGCDSSISREVYVDDSNMFFVETIQPADCGESNGAVTVTAPGAPQPVFVQLDGTTQVITSTGGSVTFDGLSVGDYSLAVYKPSLCNTSRTIQILDALEPLPADVSPASCTGAANGAITFTSDITGLSFFWSDLSFFEQTANRTDLLPGTYEVTIENDDFCSVTQSFDVGTSSDLEITTNTTQLVSGCDTISFTPTVEGGTPPYQYEWEDGSTQLTREIALSIGDEYTLTVTDSLGCQTEKTFRLFTDLESSPRIRNVPFFCESEAILFSTSERVFGLWEDEDGNILSTDDTLIVTQSGRYRAYALGSDGEVCPFVYTTFFVVGADLFEPVLAPGLPCEPPNYSIELEGEFNWYDIDENLIIGNSYDFFPTSPGQYILEGTFIFTGYDTCVLRDTFEVFFPECQLAEGTIWIDEGDCQLSGTEIGLANSLVSFTSTGPPPAEVYYATSDASGNWSIVLPLGAYQLGYAGPSDDLYIACPGPLITVEDGIDLENVDVLVTAIEDCPRVSVDLSVPFLRRCFESNLFVNYFNTGPVEAQNASITVELDPFLIFESADFPVSIDGQTLTFDLGDLAAQTGGSIQIAVTVSCEAELGQTHCIQATATPNDPCPTPDMAWMGGTVNITPICDDDQSRFVIENIGTGDMTVSLSYIIVEDGVMLRDEPYTEDALDVAQTVEFPLPDPDKSYWIQSNQEPFSPGDPMPTAFSAGCGNNPVGTFTNQFGNGDETYWYEEVCLPNIGAYDPNDNTALPVGYGSDRFIEPGTPIDYLIRFQNTGTDTAFNVRLVDTLDTDLDLSTFEVLSASHDFRPELDTAGILNVYFDNIMLPDSNVDFRGSNGFFSYRVTPRADQDLPFLVTNRAGIYFDFNAPIITNTVLHTVDTNFVLGPNSIGQVPTPLAELTISPNPSPNGRYWLDIETTESGPFIVRLTDKLGRVVSTEQGVGKRSRLDYSELPNSSYQLSIFDQSGRWLATEQIIR
ncbi:MAG: hypothetical protein AAF741_04695 [Bacteroidota bacterium]